MVILEFLVASLILLAATGAVAYALSGLMCFRQWLNREMAGINGPNRYWSEEERTHYEEAMRFLSGMSLDENIRFWNFVEKEKGVSLPHELRSLELHHYVEKFKPVEEKWKNEHYRI